MRAIAAAVLLVVAGIGTFYATNQVYWQRFFAVLQSGGNADIDSYEPTEDVPGAHAGFMAVAPPEERTIPEDVLAEAREYASKNASSSLLIWHKGKLQSADYFGITPDTRVNSRSLHKMLGGLVIATAIKNGHIASLDDPVAKYITEWQGTPKEKMTIRNVLQMSSGLMWFRGGGPYSVSSRRYIDPNWDDILLNRVPLEFEPGSAYDYSDMTADIMPHIIQRATGKRYSEYLSEAVLKPLGAADGKLWMNREGGMPHGGCCLMMPPENWLRIGLLALNRGQVGDKNLLPDWWMDEWLKPSANNPHFGLMVWLGQPYAQRRLYHRPNSPNNRAPRPGAYHSEPYLADDIFLFDGLNGQIVYIIPSQGLVIVRTGLRPPRTQPEWDNAKLPNMVLRGLGQFRPVFAAPKPSAPPPAVENTFDTEARFWKRWMTLPDQTPRSLVQWVDIPEIVKGGSGADMPAAVTPSIAPEALAAATAYAEKTKSLSLIVWQGGEIQLEKYWDGFTRDDRSETYSMAKSVVGLATGLAVDRGFIRSVNDAAANYITEWKNGPKETLTVRQLLTMSSGIDHYRFNYAFQSPWATGLRTFFGPDVAGTVLNYGIDRVPGAEFNYNSANSQILLTLIERATGRRYADFVSENLWQPIDAKDATLWLDRPGGTPKAYSYFQARPIDWLKLGILFARRGAYGDKRIISADWMRQMTDPSPVNPNYGFQVWLASPKSGKRIYNRNTPAGATHSAPYLVNEVVFFDGGGGHRVYAIPSRDLVIVRTGSVNRPDWDDAILPNAILAGQEPPEVHPLGP